MIQAFLHLVAKFRQGGQEDNLSLPASYPGMPGPSQLLMTGLV